MKRVHLLALLTVLFFVVPTFGQVTIQPVIQEFGQKVHGSFTITNGTLQPMNVEVQPFSFHVKDGLETFVPIDPHIQVTMSPKDSTFKLGPMGNHIVSFHAHCDTAPCHFVLLSNISGKPNPNGLTLRSALPEVIYVCEKQKHCRIDTLKSWGLDLTPKKGL